MIRIAVSGSEGRMGKRIINLAERDKGVVVAAKFDIGADPEPLIKKCDVLIEFTIASATMSHLAIAERLNKAIVIGTTALSGKDIAGIRKASRKIPVVFSPNMSVGVNVLFKLSRDAAKILPEEYKIEMTEAHHIHKKDAPSGTAKKLAEIVAGQRKRDASSINIESRREGEIVGDHRLIFDSPTEKLELAHSAKTRDTFAAGAITAAKFLKEKKNGLYTMQDVLGI